jgi:hypothetical protein
MPIISRTKVFFLRIFSASASVGTSITSSAGNKLRLPDQYHLTMPLLKYEFTDLELKAHNLDLNCLKTLDNNCVGAMYGTVLLPWVWKLDYFPIQRDL